MAKVFIQENEQEILEILCIALQLENVETYAVLGYDVDFVGLINRFKPNVVILDYRLDGKECVQVAKMLKKTYPTLPLIASSCNAKIDEDYCRYGFDGYLSKPFDLECLYQTLKNLINSR